MAAPARVLVCPQQHAKPARNPPCSPCALPRPRPQVNATYPDAYPTFRPAAPGHVWVSTGLWAKAGSMITFQLDSAWVTDLKIAGRTVGIQIGSHFADLSM